MKFLTQAAKALQEKKRYQHRLAIFLCLAIVVTLGTFAALKLRGQAMTHQRKVLKCQVEIHQHSEECYDKEEKGKLICGQADYVAHKHNDDCYNLDSGELVCHIKELEVHKHDDNCYQEEKVLVCKEEEKEAHTHTPECYIREKGDLQCVLEEHAHAEACYIRENTGLQCGFEEHTHADGCYDETGALTCQQEEHQHSDDCYAWTETLNCPLEEHQHNDDCYTWTETLACQQEEVQDGHMHTDECYETKKTLVCEKEEVELHTHDENCQDENGALICNKLQVEEHIHGAECFETVELNDEEVAALNTPEPEEEEPAGDNSASSSSANEDSASKNSTSKNSASGNSTSDNSSASGNSASDNETGHVHDESCYDSAGGLMCGFEGETPDITKVCETEDYIVTAVYKENANIPEEAELLAELITADKDEEHYAKREAEIKEALKDENVSMNALFKIGFYVDGKEIEPESDVSVTVQFLDENGLAEGSPIAIIHFADGGNQVLNGGKAKNKSTTFRTKSFSEFGIVEGFEVPEEEGEDTETEENKDTKESNIKEDVSESDTIPVSETYDYEDAVYHIKFQIEGEVTLPDDEEYGDVISENGDSADEVSEDEIEISKPGEETSEDEETAIESTEEENISENKSSKESAESEEDTSTSENKAVDTEELKFEVHALDKDTDEYAAVMDAYGEKSKELLAVRAFQYSLTYGGEDVNRSNCTVTAEVKPSAELSKLAKTSMPKAMSYLYNSDGIAVDSDSEEETQIEITVVGIPAEMSEGEITETNSIVLDEESSDVVTVSTKANDIMFTSARSAVNPKFTVEYYAYLDRVVQNPKNVDDKNLLEVINTDGNNLPTNTDTLPTVKIAVSSNNKILTDRQLTEVYREKDYEYKKAPSISYFNALNDNPHYELKEIWVKDTSEGTAQTNINGTGVNKSWKTEKNQLWRVYSGKISNVHFTNFDETAKKDPTYILIKDYTCIRLIYEPNTKDEDFAATLYDYDISDGWTTSGTGANTIYQMDTSAHGINTPSNYEKGTTGAMYAFGNQNCGTNTEYKDASWNGNKLNRGNSGVFQGCTFQLATGVDENNNVLFNTGIRQLNIFGTEEKKGKTIYGASNLVFSNKGDTYTLTRANVAKEEGTTLSTKGDLDTFINPQCGPIKYDGIDKKVIWTNNFWPLDGEGIALNQNSNDHKFGQANEEGKSDKKKKYQPYGTWQDLPVADDGIDHNCFFGMFYEVEFDLDESYCGPLEYYFFGDDDMWVFLDDTTLVCDIGGVHSSVGEYVNLWDYLQENKNGQNVPKSGKHTLKFFYTERGASGSSCWMQFTLPSVTSMKNQTTGKVTNTLKVGKTVENADPNKQYEFKIHFTKDGDNLLDQYSYTKYKEVQKVDEAGNPVFDSEGKPVYVTDPKPIETDVIVYDGSTFFLGDREYIIVDYLPDGTTYTVEELSKSDDYDIVTSINGTAGNTGEITGDIGDGTQNGNKVEHVVDYINDYKTYNLPETGGSGMKLYTMAGALCIMFGTGFLYKRRFRERRG